MPTTPIQPVPETVIRPGFWRLFLIWATIGLQSFGGGASTTFLIQREFIEKRHWMTMEEFTHFWSLCVLTPGINLVGMTILIGRKFGGIGGVCSSLLGMLLPSAALTCLIAAIFKDVESLPAVQAVVKGIVPATAGIMFIVGLNFALPQFKLARSQGIVNLLICIVFIAAVIIAIAVLNIAITIVLPVAGLTGLILFTYILVPRKRKEKTAHD